MKDLSFSALARELTDRSLNQAEPLDPPMVDENPFTCLVHVRPQLLADMAEAAGYGDDSEDED